MIHDFPLNFYTKYIQTPAGRQVKSVVKDRDGIPRVDEMGEDMESGVAEAITLSPPKFDKDIMEPIALTSRQMLELGFLGTPDHPDSIAREKRMQDLGYDIVVMPKKMYEFYTALTCGSYLNWGHVTDKCVTIQVKYQPYSYAYGTVNFETRQKFDYRREFNKSPTYVETKNNADYTAYVVTDKVVILTPSGILRGYANSILTDHPLSSGKKIYSKNNKDGYYSRTNFTKRISLNTLLSDDTTQVLSLSPLFAEYHIKASAALEDDTWEHTDLGYGLFAQDWSLSTMKTFLRSGIWSLFEDKELKEGVNLRGTPHYTGL